MENIDTTIPEGKERLAELLVDAILSEEQEKMPAPYVVKIKSYKAYEKALCLLAELKGKGLCEFTYDSIFKPYYTHFIDVKWNYDEDDIRELEAREIATLIENFDGLVLSKRLDEWQLSTQIYFPKEMQ